VNITVSLLTTVSARLRKNCKHATGQDGGQWEVASLKEVSLKEEEGPVGRGTIELRSDPDELKRMGEENKLGRNENRFRLGLHTRAILRHKGRTLEKQYEFGELKIGKK